MGNNKPFPRDDMVVLLSLDEGSYKPGGLAMGDHPIAWYKGWDGGRSFQTALGHTEESWSDPVFMDHVWGGIEWARAKTGISSSSRSSTGSSPLAPGRRGPRRIPRPSPSARHRCS